MPVDDTTIRTHLERLIEPVDDPDAVVAEVLRRASGRRHRVLGARVLVAVAVLAVVGVAAALVALPDGTGGGGGVAAVGAGTAVGTRLAVPPVGEADAALLDDGTPVWVVAHEGGEVVVVDARSTHRPHGIPHLVGWCPTSRGFEDPAHGSRWEPWGHVAGGPAPSGLPVHPTEPDGGGAVRVTGPAAPSEEPPLDTRRGPLNILWPDCPDDENDSGWVSYTPGTPELLQHHDAGGLAAVTLEEAARDHEGQVVLVEGSPILVPRTGDAVACRADADADADPAGCAGLAVPQAVPVDERTSILEGRFLARVRDDTLVDVALVDPPG